MITKIIYWMLNRLFLHHEAQMLESRNSSRRNAMQAAIDEYHMTRARDALNVAIEGAVGECKEHAAATANARVITAQDRFERGHGDLTVRIIELEQAAAENCPPPSFGVECGEEVED